MWPRTYEKTCGQDGMLEITRHSNNCWVRLLLHGPMVMGEQIEIAALFPQVCQGRAENGLGPDDDSSSIANGRDPQAKP